MDSFNKISNIDFDRNENDISFGLPVAESDMVDLEGVVLKMTDLLAGGVASIGAGGLAGLAAYGSVGALASTAGGTAIGSLTGVAATNATLAWLGGGALSAGGLGMAGGTAILGGIVAGPVLAVGGMMLASKAEEARHNAYSNLSAAKAAAEQCENAGVRTLAIHGRATEVHETLNKLDEKFTPFLDGLQIMIERSPKDDFGNVNYQYLSEENKNGVMIAFSIAKTMKNVMEAQIISDNGDVSTQSDHALEVAVKNMNIVQEKAKDVFRM